MVVRVKHAQWEDCADAFSSRHEREINRSKFWGIRSFSWRPSAGAPSDLTFPEYAFSPAAMADLQLLLMYVRRFGGTWTIMPLPVRIG